MAYPKYPRLINLVKGVSSSFVMASCVLYVVLSYVIGFFFFRRDPKDPDMKSFFQIKHLLEKGDKDLKKWVIRKSENKVESTESNNGGKNKKVYFILLKLSYDILSVAFPAFFLQKAKFYKLVEDRFDEYDVQFPYLYLKDYLQTRNLKHLTPFISWDGNNNFDYRSKNLINILKIRLHFFFPDKVRVIVRNEAHVRLSASAWFSLGALRYISVWSSICLLVLWFLLFYKVNSEAVDIYDLMIIPLLINFLIASICIFARLSISKFLHYQRVREIIFVLETFYCASVINPLITDGLGFEKE